MLHHSLITPADTAKFLPAPTGKVPTSLEQAFVTSLLVALPQIKGPCLRPVDTPHSARMGSIVVPGFGVDFAVQALDPAPHGVGVVDVDVVVIPIAGLLHKWLVDLDACSPLVKIRGCTHCTVAVPSHPRFVI